MRWVNFFEDMMGWGGKLGIKKRGPHWGPLKGLFVKTSAMLSLLFRSFERLYCQDLKISNLVLSSLGVLRKWRQGTSHRLK